MAFTETADIMRRIEAALEYDLLGKTGAPTAVADDVNGHLPAPLNSRPICERVERFVLDPVGAGDLYATMDRTGITVGYSFATTTPEAPQGGQGQDLRQAMPVQISVIRVVDSARDLINGTPGFDLDNVMDDIDRAFGNARRDGTHFGVQTLTKQPAQQLEGGTRQAPWSGRVMQMVFTRSLKDLEV
jgi:hypothetical protein